MPRRLYLIALIASLALLISGASAQEMIIFSRVDTLIGINEPERPTYGPTVGDYDADGYDDVFVGNHADLPNLFHNETDGTFSQVWSAGTGIGGGGDRHGAAWGDYNNDGRRDLYVAIGAQRGLGVGYNQLYYNLGETHFIDVSGYAGTCDSLGRGRYSHWFDVDNDGWLDLLVLNCSTRNQLFMNQGDGTFRPSLYGGGLGSDDKYLGALTQWDDDRYMDIILSAIGTGALSLHRNTQSGTFLDITSTTGLPTTLWNVRGLAWLDYDNDGDQDLYLIPP